MPDNLGTIIWTLCYTAVLLGLSIYGLHRYLIVYLYLKNKRNVPVPAGHFDKLPRVTVQLPIFNELYVVERLLDAVSKLDYPRDLLDVQVLDDSTDETRELANKLVGNLQALGLDISHVHRVDRTGYKAGALENGLQSAKGEYILILDADFVPAPDVLQKTIHFFTNEKVGMIQTRWGHLNRTYSMLTRVQAMFLDGHLLLEQTGRNRSGRFINFNGTAGVWRKSCIVDAGGWQHDTLTEDLDLSYRAQIKGWKFIFLPNLVTPAELPVDMNGFKSQQHRWTKGSIQTCRKLLPAVWRANLPLKVKLEGTVHLTSNYAFLLLAFICVLMHPGADGGTHNMWHTILLDIPIFITGSMPAIVFYIVSQRELYPRSWWREILYLPALIALTIGLAVNNAWAVIQGMVGATGEFTRTPKYGIQTKTQSWKKSKYSVAKNILPLVEVSFAIYFIYFLTHEIILANWYAVPFLSLFASGFTYVALCSLAQWFPQLRAPWRDTGDALSA